MDAINFNLRFNSPNDFKGVENNTTDKNEVFKKETSKNTTKTELDNINAEIQSQNVNEVLSEALSDLFDAFSSFFTYDTSNNRLNKTDSETK